MTEVNGRDRILIAKSELDVVLKNFVEDFKKCDNNSLCISMLIGKLSTKNTDILNTVSKVIADLHEEYDFFENKNLQNDYIGTVENFIFTSIHLIKSVNLIASQKNLTQIPVSPKAFFTVQRFVNTFSDNSSKEELIKMFEDNNISLSGFQQKFSKTMKTKFIKLQLWLGVPLLLLCGITVLFTESIIGKSFNGIQLIFLKAFISLTISIVASSLIEGNATIRWTLQKGLIIRAVGWVAVFLLIYFLNPASPGDVH